MTTATERRRPKPIIRGSINPDVTYTSSMDAFVVRLSGKIIGEVIPVSGGWQYVPKGARPDRLDDCGEVLPTFAQVKQSLEAF